VSELPDKDALLLLVVYRHDVESTAVAFESHMFGADEANPQVAIIDTYIGTTDFKPIIYAGNQSEKLQFGKVISVNPGDYVIRLQNDANVSEDVVAVQARRGEKYVVLRSGIVAQRGPSFQQELITYPKPEDEEEVLRSLKSGARSGVSTLLLPAILMAFQQRLGSLALLAALLTQAHATQLVPAAPKKAAEVVPSQLPRLRVCNAFPSDEPLSVAWRGTALTEDKPIAYKECRDLEVSSAMQAGEKLHIGVRDGPSNTFQLAGLPKSASLLLLVCFRQGQSTLDLTFRSHAFGAAQKDSVSLAVLDTYDGTEKSEVRIGRDMEMNAGGGEKLWYDSVVSVNPGDYKLWLRSDDSTKDDLTFSASSSAANYVVMRVGGEAHESSKQKGFPQELVLFPETAAKGDLLRDGFEHRSDASSVSVSLLLLAIGLFH